MSIEVRPFRRSDRDQLTGLVNAHVAAVVPGVVVSVNAVLAQLEREPEEFIVDPWVVDRETIVAEQRGSVVAAAHLLRYGRGAEVGESYRDGAEIRWLLCSVDAPFWPDASAAGRAVAEAAVARLESWGASKIFADGTLPAPGVYGIPDQWPHVAALLESVGFRHDGRTEVLLIARVADLSGPAPLPESGVELRRTLGINGTRFAAVRGEEALGFVEVEALADASRQPRVGGLADIGNFEVAEEWRGRGLDTWLLAQAADWLRLAGVDRLLAYASPDEAAWLAFLAGAGFRELTRTRRGWVR